MLTLFGNGGIDENAIVGKLSQLNNEKQEFEDQIPQEMKIRIAVPLEFITIEQTSA